MDWTLLIFLIPISIMGIAFYKAFQLKKNPPAPVSVSEAKKKFKILNQKIEIGIGIFSLFVAIFFAIDLFGPRVEGKGKILTPLTVSTYQVRINGGLPIRFEEQALFLQKRGDRESYSFITSPELAKKIGSPDKLPVDVTFEETLFLKTTTAATFEGQRFEFALGSMQTVGLIATSFLALLGLVGNRRVIAKFLRKKP